MLSPSLVAAARPRLVALRRSALLAVAALTAAVLAAPTAAAAVNPLPPAGRTYERLAVDWWQYALGQPAATNPLQDTTGEHCATGQSGPVFFLVGALGSASVTRECTIRPGRRLFFPLLNAFDVHVPGDGLDTPELVYQDFLSFGFSADTLFATVDGHPIGNLVPATTPYRACAAPTPGCFPESFSITFPQDNLFGLDAGVYEPAVQDGYYLLLPPLPPGEHTIRFGGTGTFAGSPISQDITYHLVVKPKGRAARHAR